MSFRSPLQALASFSCRHPKVMLSLAGGLVLLALFGTRFLELKTSNLDLMDPNQKEIAKFIRFSREFGTPNALVVVLEGEEPQALEAAVGAIASRLRALPGIRGVIERLPVEKELLRERDIEEYLTSDDGSLYFLFVQPEDPRSEAAKLAPLVAQVQKILDEVAPDHGGVRAGLTGIPKYALDDRDIIQRDISRLSLLSLLLIFLLFWSGFQGLVRPLLAVFSLLIGVILVLGLVAIYPGHLTLVSALFASMLLGLGIDYGIHLITGVEEATEAGFRSPEAILHAVSRQQRGLVSAALTTTCVFWLLPFSGFRGYAELGLIAGTGNLICMLMMFSVLPALLVLVPARATDRARSRWIPQKFPVWKFGRYLVPFFLALGALLLFQGGPGFDADYRNLQPAGSEAVRLERLMEEESDYAPYFAVFVRPNAQEAAALADRLREEPTVAAVRSLTDLDLFFADLEHPPEVTEEFRRFFQSKTGRYAVYAYPAASTWDSESGEAFLKAMRNVDPEVTGMPFLGAWMIRRSRRALEITAALALLVLAGITMLDFRDWRKAALVLMPPVFTLIGTSAIMRLTGMAFNPLNVMAIPIVLGIAVDDGIHMVHRFYHERGDLTKTLRGTGRAVILTSLTTLAAFGSICFTAHRGLRSFCLTLSIGVLCALFLSLFVLPSLLAGMEISATGKNHPIAPTK